MPSWDGLGLSVVTAPKKQSNILDLCRFHTILISTIHLLLDCW